MKKALVRTIALAAAALLLWGCPSYAAQTQSDIDAQIKRQEQEFEKIQKQISQNQQKLSEAAKREKTVTNQLLELSEKITLTQQSVNVVSLKIQKVKDNIFALDAEIKKTNKDIATAQAILSKRMVSIYKYGGVAEFNLYMSSQGAEDALANSYLLGKIAEQDRKLIDYLTDQRRKLTMTQGELRKEHSTLKDQNADLAKRNKELKNAADERNSVLEKVRKDKKLFMAEQEELKKSSQELQTAIKRLLKEKQQLKAREDAAKRKQGKPVAPPTAYYKGGRLAWPVQGKITSQFGTRVHPTFKTKITHTGLDIAAPKGTPVKAADPGEVLYTGWMRGYGQVVVVDHGANLTTVYAHLSKIETSEDAKVTRSTVIGRVGATGVATGDHLHFEVRVDGDAVNPMKYLK